MDCIIRKVRRGVYTLTRARLSPRARWIADVLACGPGALLAGECAAMLLGLRPVTRRRTTVVTTARGRRKPMGIDLKTTRRLDPEDVMVVDGIPVTSLARTLIDCAAILDEEQLESAIEHAVVEHDLQLAQLAQRATAAAGLPGAASLGRVLEDIQLGRSLTRSDVESLFRRILKDAGLPMPGANATIWTGERHYEADFLWREQRLIVEIDGWSTHRARIEAHRRREAHLHALGYRIQRFTRLQLLRRPDEVIRALRPDLYDATRRPCASPAA